MDQTPEQLLEVAQAAQSAYWEALHDLEDALDIELDGTDDLSAHTVESLLEEFGE